jgi:putative Mg2+ transporter-C (MgtC) family protein
MDSPFHDLFEGLTDSGHLVKVPIRLLVAVTLGGIIGWERRQEGKAAGLRTHMMVCLGSALFTLVGVESGMSKGDLSRIIQGVATGIGFLGAGTILKADNEQRVHGLTSAAAIWVTAAVGMAVGAGWLWPAVLGVLLAWVIMLVLKHGK